MAAADPALPFASEGEIEAAYLRSKELFATGETKPIAWRLKQLQKLRAMIVKHEATIESAIVADMHRADFEAQIFETRPCIAQIDDTISFITSGSLSRGVSVPLALGTASARVEMVPKGAVLIIGAWNYPAALTLGPLVDVLGAGNTAVIKPSELSPRSASVIGRLLEETFTDGEVLVLHGAVKETTQILKLRWDHIVYTGSSPVGRIVMSAAAKHLTPVTLELGGKCPVIVDATADMTVACRRIAQARFANAGQTCLAADYVLVERPVADAFIRTMKKTVREFYTDSPQSSPDFGRVVNQRHTRRIASLIEEARSLGGTVVVGGESDIEDCYIAPTVMTDVPLDTTLQREETFGPVLLVQPVDSVDEALERVNAGEKPLALYVFSSDSRTIAKVEKGTLSGSLAINDALMQRGIVSAPFGGVGESGMGSYSAGHGVREFSHHRTVFSNPTLLDIPLRYPPYSGFTKGLIGSLVGTSLPPLSWRQVAVPLGIGVLLFALFYTGYFKGDRLARIQDAFSF
ncbi:hypothetical protein FNF27_02441 [Cafeteria roenbergensis]|uniref:Aldehyde dehydrogenase n=1 Tax=Cafeteria roenbergensis TaxID=33653 RepID=A0A5A8CGK4_CAFRO|nr:hypothetical protein FNF29_04431 [Cafeteria roenbergensis]KAA0176049.1 hypothetical protein FNF27_02441 [Cafeteria roenbergensis]|eukprot:KAA0151747.1 hypothetical protein FNF29_04431 [Cafeteria roenbergensis]